MPAGLKRDLSHLEDRGEAVASATRTLQLETEGLSALQTALTAHLAGSFTEALEILGGCRGRVIVTGMGKSGHVGHKIAATLASTGTPAFFVHPGEASHGDLGMITGKDAVIAISNSGETAEISDVMHYTRRFQIPLIGITGKAGSSLANSADVALILPEAEEACPMGLAPTTSTTVTLALGDALAVALLERRGFTQDDFHKLHPGGKLGSKLLRVSDLMATGEDMPIAAEGQVMQDAVIVMTGRRFGCLGIVDDAGALTGIITDGDLRRHMTPDMLGRQVTDLMTAGPVTIRPDALAAEALAVMNERRINVLFAVESGRPVGIMHMHDILQAGVA